MRTTLAVFLTLFLVAVAVVVGVLAGASTIQSEPSPLPTRSLVVATPLRTPVPAATVAPDSLRVFSVGTIPPDSHFVLAGDEGDERLLLIDLGGNRVIQAAHFEGAGGFNDGRVVEISAITSGELLLIQLRAASSDARLYVIQPVTGAVRSFTTPKGEQPRISPDGVTIAVTRSSADPGQNGLWLLNSSDGLGRRIVADGGRKATRAIQWSADGQRISVLVDRDGQTQLAVVNTVGDITPFIDKATDARWRGSDLVYWNADAVGPVKVYDASSAVAAIHDAYPAEPGIFTARVEVRPGSADLAVHEHSQVIAGRISVRGSGPSKVVAADSTRVIGFWWSNDARHLYGWDIGRGTTTVTDLLTGAVVVTFCFRQRIEPPCP